MRIISALKPAKIAYININCHGHYAARDTTTSTTQVNINLKTDYEQKLELEVCDWIGLSSVLRPLQHGIGYMGDGFYRSKEPTNSIKVLKEEAVKEKPQKQRKHKLHMHTHTK